MRPMKIDLYTRCWNEAEMLGFFFRHYDPLVDRYIVYDDGSSDASPALLRANPKADVRPTPSYSDLTSRTVSELADFNHFWKESRGSRLGDRRRCRRTSLPPRTWAATCRPARGRGSPSFRRSATPCCSDEFPADDVLLRCAITSGAPDIMMSKLAIFSPDAVAETSFAVGRHTAEPEGDIVAPPRDELLLLHYKYLSFERTFRRNQESRSRQRGKDIEMGWGIQYSWTRQQLLDRWNNLAGKVVDVADPNSPAGGNPYGESLVVGLPAGHGRGSRLSRRRDRPSRSACVCLPVVWRRGEKPPDRNVERVAFFHQFRPRASLLPLFGTKMQSI